MCPCKSDVIGWRASNLGKLAIEGEIGVEAVVLGIRIDIDGADLKYHARSAIPIGEIVGVPVKSIRFGPKLVTSVVEWSVSQDISSGTKLLTNSCAAL